MPAEQTRALTMMFPTDLASHAWFMTLAGFLEELPIVFQEYEQNAGRMGDRRMAGPKG